MGTSTVKRNSSIELLRILVMLMVVFLHISAYGGYHHVAYTMGGKHELLFRLVWLQCRCAVPMLVVIMGYFTSAAKEHNLKKVLKVYLPMYFYAVVIPLVVKVTGILGVSKNDILKGFFPFISRTWYFLTLYLVLLLLAPYINKAIHAMSRKEYLTLLGILFFLFCVWQMLANISPFDKVVGIRLIAETERGKSLYDFIFMYLIGGFLRNHTFITNKRFTDKWKNWMNLAMFLLVGLLNTFCMYMFPAIKTVILYNDYPFYVIQCIFLFRFFSNMQFYSGAINAISACNLGVYMLHEHPLLRTIIWDHLFDVSSKGFYAKHTYVLKIAGIVFVVYLGCVVIEFVRQRLFQIPGMIVHFKKERKDKDAESSDPCGRQGNQNEIR